ncbi:MAG: DUF1501 domain-containing protein [Planctomycetota bacterium]|nr:MAG: DUF1501 domain-containing protein [Planctomycetota bacterium]
MPTPCRNYFAARRPNRREVLRAGSLGLLGMSLDELLAGKAAVATSPVARPSSFGRAKSCILLFMWGGPSQLETWDPKPDAPAEIRGEFKPIATKVPGIQICEHFPQLAKRTDKLAVVRSMTHGDVNHLTSTHYLLTGQAPPPSGEVRAQWPHIGSVLGKLRGSRGALPASIAMRPKVPGDVPRFVEESQGQKAGWLGPVYDPFIIDEDPNRPDYRVGSLALDAETPDARIRNRAELLAALDRLATDDPVLAAKRANDRRALELLTKADAGGAAFDLSQETPAMRERYGLNPHGQSVLQARRLVERGVPLVTVFWPNEGIKNVSVYWDTHSRNFIDHRERLMPVADRAFSALLDDLAERGMLDETLVVWTGEFGRTPKVGQVNSDAGAGADGRDHWPGCFSTVLAGGPVRGGLVYGRSDRHAAFPAADAVTPADLVATVYHALGVPREQIVRDLADRPHFVRPGTAIEALFA